MTKTKQAENEKHSLKDCTEHFLNFSYKNTVHNKIILFDAALLEQKNTMRAGYAEQSIK